MKNRNFIKNSIVSLLPIAMAVGALFGVYKKPIEEAKAYEKDGILATTIDLNDCTAQDIKNYYSNLNSLSSTELQGQNLLKNLKPILKNGQKYYKYDSDGVWELYEIIDRDWKKSPADQIPSGYGTYDAKNNIITNYKYGTSTSNIGSNPYVHALYVDRTVDNLTTAWGDHQQTQWGINQEHIWPKSQGFNASGAGGARGDPMHLWAGNGRVNGTEHNNNMYGFVDLSKDYTNPFDKKGFKNLKDNYSGKSLTVPSSNDTVFEPQDCDKGDIARSIFYMVARYNNIAGDDVIDQNNPNLALKQTTEALASYTTTTENKQTGYMGLMTDLLYWNHLDPVDEFEIHRNNLLFNNYTHNRNPFIDYPEWADYIWGKPVYNGRNYVSYSSTPTGFVNLTTDIINGFKGVDPSVVTVKSLEIVSKPTKLIYRAGETLDTTGLSVKARMSDNTTKVLGDNEFTISPNAALKATDTKVTITYQGVSAEFDIAIKGGTSAGVSYNIVAETYASASFTTQDKSFIVASNKTDQGSTAPTYSETGKDIRVYAKGTFGIESKVGNMQKIVFNISSQGKKRLAEITPSTGSVSYDLDKSIMTWTGDSNKVTFTVGDKATYGSEGTSKAGQLCFEDFTVTLKGSEIPVINVSSISLNKNSTTLQTGASEKLIATVNPSNASVKLVTWESSNTSAAEVTDEGEITAKSQGNAVITCKSLDDPTKTAICSVTVAGPVTLESITLSGTYNRIFTVGDEFTCEGLVVTANYSDGSSVDVTEDVEISGYDMSAEGPQTITVSYEGKIVTYVIQVNQPDIPPIPMAGIKYAKISSLSDIEEGAKYIIGYETDGKLLALPNTFAKKMGPVELTLYQQIVLDDNNECVVTLCNVTSGSTTSASITNGTNYLNATSSDTDFTIGTSGVNWTITVDNGEFLFENERALIYRAGTTNKFGNYASSNLKNNEYHKVCLYKEVPTPYKLVTDVSTLGNEDEIIIVGVSSKKYYAMGDYSTTNSSMRLASVKFENNIIYSTSASCSFTLEKSNGKFGLKSARGYFSAPGTSSYTCVFKETQDNLSTFSISIGISNSATIAANVDSGSRYIRYNASSSIMSCYTSNKIASDVYIYKKASQYDADEWSRSFLEITYNCEMTESQWNDLSTSYSELSSDAKHEISSASPVYDNDSNLRQQAAARYDYIVSDPRYDVEAFISDRAVAPANRNVITLINIKDNPTLFIVLFALAGLTTIGAYVYIKRRKEADI